MLFQNNLTEKNEELFKIKGDIEPKKVKVTMSSGI